MRADGAADHGADMLDPFAAFAGRVNGGRAPFALPTVAASAPVLLELSKQMREARAASDDPRLRAVLEGILDGRAPLSTLLSAGVLPAPPAVMPQELRELLERNEEKQ